MLTIKIYAGKKANFLNGNKYSYEFTCVNDDDIDNVFGILAENLVLKNPHKDLIDFPCLKDIDVISLLADAKQHGFISDYEIM